MIYDVEQAIGILDTLLEPRQLSDLQELLLRECWQGKSYQEIAEEFDYEAGYLRIVGSRLWQELSDTVGEKITKSNIRSVLRRQLQVNKSRDKIIQKQETENNFKSQENLSFYSLERNNLELFKPSFPGCSVSINSPFYVERFPIESLCCREILQPGALIRIKAPQKMGKTSLLNYIISYGANKQGYKTVRLSFQQADQGAISNLNHLLRWFCKIISWKLNIEPKLDDYWEQDSNLAKSSCTRYFEEYLLPQLSDPLLLGLDEVERIFSYPQVAQDFLPLLRVWYEEANENPIWQKLRLLLVYSTEDYLPLNINQSPFNVGLPIALPEWNFQQVKHLARGYGLNWGNDETRQLMELVGGHPYLVQLALYYLQEQNATGLAFFYPGNDASQAFTFEKLLEYAPTESGIYNNHLRRQLEYLQDSQLAAAMKQVVSSSSPVLLASQLVYRLQSIGLVKLCGDKAMPSCELYRQYFRVRLTTP
ncbi:AAA-like domain-containing protein [Lyngbya aestuarii]|uniref:AAA-like domain-containing protein n=1 Tax=Lyngbya aestuarii TaxID=118322 RepID=UPI00403DB1F4